MIPAIGKTLLIGLLSMGALAAQESASTPAVEQLAQYRNEMRAARQANRWKAYLMAAQQQAVFLHQSPASRLEVARAQIHLGHRQAALDQLLAFTAVGQTSPFINESPELEPLRHAPPFAAIQKSMAANRMPIAHASSAVTVADPGLLPEDIDYDPETSRFFLSSILKHKIVSVDADGHWTDFAAAPDPWPVQALKIDHQRQLLWATEVAIHDFEPLAAADRGRSVLLCYDLRSGKLLRRIEGPTPVAFGDMTLTAAGDVIVSDGEHGGIYRLAQGSAQLTRIDRGDFISPQTPAVAADGVRLYVADYTRGIGILELNTGRVQWMKTAGRFALNGIDGLYRVNNQLIAIQNGAEPERVIEFSLDASGRRITAESIIERATASLGDPTHAVMVDGLLYFIANSGWDALDPKGHMDPAKTMTNALIMRSSLPRK
jgi:hypothetical protein